MSRLLAGFAALAIVAAPAVAAGYGFEATYTGAAVPTVGALTISVNADIVRETNSIRTNDYGVSYIAPEDAEDLIQTLREELEEQLTDAGKFTPGSGGTLTVTIENATPSNPAHTENGRNANLDFRSAGRGGATLAATLVAADGSPVAEYSYRWEESTFDVGAVPRIGWYGAERAFDRFADRLARELSSDSTIEPAS